MPRKPRVAQKSRRSSLSGPRPPAATGPFDWTGRRPDHADELTSTPSALPSDHTDFWADGKEVDLAADAELYGADDREAAPSDGDLVRRYLSELGGFARLTPAEEVALAKRIEQGRGRKRRRPSSRTTPRLERTREGPEAEGTLWVDQLDSDQARVHMIRANLRLVVSIAKQFSGRGLALLDLVQEGNLGLMKAVDRFDWRRGCRFGTYASWWIKQSIGRAVSDQGRTVRLPAHITDSMSRVQRLRQEWLQRYEGEPAAHELSKAARVSEERLAQIDQLTAPPVSLDWVLPDGEHTVGEQLPDETYPPRIDVLVDRERDHILHSSLGELPVRERRVLCMHFGIGYRRAYTLEEIGREFRLTRERIRQIEARALKKLRQPGRCRLLEA